MQNQFMNVNTKDIEKIIQPFKEKIKNLEEELMKKDIEIAKLKYTISQMNIQFNPMFPYGNPNINQMFPIGNQMNMLGNTMMPSPIPKEIKKKKKIKIINLKFNNLEYDFIIQCKSKDIMEDVIKKYCLKEDI